MTPHVVAGERLKARLERSAEEAGCRLTWMTELSRAYNAVMFTGGEHRLTVAVDGLSGRAWIGQLDDGSVDVPGFALMHLEAEIVELKGGQLFAEIEAITVREA